MSVDQFDHALIHNSYANLILKNSDFKIVTLEQETIIEQGKLIDKEQDLFTIEVIANDQHFFNLCGNKKDGEIPSIFTIAHMIFLTDLYTMQNRIEAETIRDSSLILAQDIKAMIELLHDGDLTFDQLIDQYLRTLLCHLQFSRCSIYLSLDGNSLTGYRGIMNGNIVELDNRANWVIESTSLIGTAAINQNIFYSNHPIKDDSFVKLDRHSAQKNICCIPVTFDNHLQAMINLSNKVNGEIDERDIKIAEHFGVLLAHLIESNRTTKLIIKNRITTNGLGKYLSKNIKDQIEDNGFSKRGSEVRQKAVCLFCDIRSFTTISEELDSKTLVSLLNIYFTNLVPIIEKHNGTIDKLVGDMIAAFWNLPREIPNPEISAVKAAIEMQKTMVQKVVPEWVEKKIRRVGIGIGIHSGNVIAGNIGSSDRLNYTVMGDAVKDTEMLESTARPGQIRVSNRVFQHVEGKVPKPKDVVKGTIFRETGKPQLVHIFSPVDYPDY